MTSVDFRCQEYTEGNRAAIAVVSGFGGDRLSYEPAARVLLDRGYDAFVYDYDPSVLLAGEPTLLPALITAMKADFESRTAETPQRRHMGHSLGCGIAWNFQKDSPGEVKPGFYSAGGTDVARLIMRNHVFRTIIRAVYKQRIDQTYRANGYDEEAMRAIWADLQEPPSNGFVLALSRADLIIPTRQIGPQLEMWQKQGVPMRVKTVRRIGHTGMKNWLVGNIPEMFRLSHQLENGRP